MIRINLLPVKQARRQVNARQELLVLGGVLAGVSLSLFILNGVTAAKIEDQEDKVRQVQTALEAQKKDVVRVEDFKKKAELLERKLAVIDERLKAGHYGHEARASES